MKEYLQEKLTSPAGIEKKGPVKIFSMRRLLHPEGLQSDLTFQCAAHFVKRSAQI